MGYRPRKDLLLTVPEAAKRRGVTPGRIRQMIREGTIPAYCKARIYLIPARALDTLPPVGEVAPRRFRPPPIAFHTHLRQA